MSALSLLGCFYFSSYRISENTNTIAQTIEQKAPVLVKKIGKTTYMVGIHFSETSKETMDDKVARLVKSDIHKRACG